ncbi:hypothetical protein Ddc_20245 [Ditylenchus destructor]|nr:hypothetical protein Ddc_20245 [Ditylenchus destructor]
MERIEGLFAAMRAASQDLEWPATEFRDAGLDTPGDLAARYAQAVSEALACLYRLRCLGGESVDGPSHQHPVCEQQAYPGYFDALLREGVFRCADAQTDPRMSKLQPPPTWRAMLDVSGQINGKTVGVLALGQRGVAREWSKREELDLRRATAKACLHLHSLRGELEAV